MVDDGSDGRSAQEILKAIAIVPNIVLLSHEKNLGVSAAKNTGFAASKGELIVPVDSDDVLEPDYLEKTLRALLGGPSDGVYTDLAIFGVENRISCSDTYPVRILSGWFPPNPVLMHRRVFEAVGGYDTDFDLGEDACFWVTAYSLGMKFNHLHEPLYRYRRHATSGTLTRGHDYPLVMTKLVRKFPEIYRENITEIVDLLAAHWVEDIITHRNLLDEFHKLDHEYNHLHSEFHVLLAKAESAEQKKQPAGIRAALNMLGREISARFRSRRAQVTRQN